MTVDTADIHDVWTYNNGDEWLARNAGCADMRLVHGLSHTNALRAAERIAKRYPGDTFEVRDVHGTVVASYGAPYREPTVQPVPRKRRPLGTRNA